MACLGCPCVAAFAYCMPGSTCVGSLELAFYGRDSVALSKYVTTYLGKGDLDMYDMSLLLVAASAKMDAENQSSQVAGGASGAIAGGPAHTAGAAVKMINAISGGVQVGGVKNASIHGGMKLEVFSHHTAYMKTTAFITRANQMGPILVDEEVIGVTAGLDSCAVEQNMDGDCFATTLYDDYVNRCHDEQLSSPEPAIKSMAEEVRSMSPFEWSRYWNPRFSRKGNKKWTKKARRKPEMGYNPQYKLVSTTFCQKRLNLPMMINPSGISMPGFKAGHERVAQWTLMIHVPYENARVLQGLFDAGVQRDSDRPWEAALAAWHDGLDESVQCLVDDSTRETGVVTIVNRKSADGICMRWADAGNGWTRLLLPSPASPFKFFPACKCLDCKGGCDAAAEFEKSRQDHRNDCQSNDCDECARLKTLVEIHKEENCLACARPDRDCSYGSRTVWRNRYVGYGSDMFAGVDAAARMRLERDHSDATALLERRAQADEDSSRFAGARFGDYDLPPGITEGDRDRAEAILAQAGHAADDASVVLSATAMKFRKKLDSLRAGQSIADADASEQKRLVRLLDGTPSCDGVDKTLESTLRRMAGPFTLPSGGPLGACPALKNALGGLLKTMADDSNASPVVQPVAAVAFSNEALAATNAVIENARAAVPDGSLDARAPCYPGSYDAMSFADAVIKFRLNALQCVKFMFVVACYEVDVGGVIVNRKRSPPRSSIGATVVDPRTGNRVREVTPSDLVLLTTLVLEGFPDGEGGFQLGLTVTGSGGAGGWVGRTVCSSVYRCRVVVCGTTWHPRVPRCTSRARWPVYTIWWGRVGVRVRVRAVLSVWPRYCLTWNISEPPLV